MRPFALTAVKGLLTYNKELKALRVFGTLIRPARYQRKADASAELIRGAARHNMAISVNAKAAYLQIILPDKGLMSKLMN